MAIAAITGYHAQIRDYPQIEEQIAAELAEIGKAYGGREVLTSYVLEEMVTLIVDRFSYLGFSEIREAYRMKADGTLQVDGAEMWGGAFTADQLGKVLVAYVAHRKRVLAAYHRAVEEQKENEGEEKRRQRYYQQFPALIAEGRTKYTDWREVPGHWFDTATSMGMLTLTEDQIVDLVSDARELVDLEHQREREEESNPFRLAGLVRGYEANRENKIKGIFQKLAVFRHLLNP